MQIIMGISTPLPLWLYIGEYKSAGQEWRQGDQGELWGIHCHQRSKFPSPDAQEKEILPFSNWSLLPGHGAGRWKKPRVHATTWLINYTNLSVSHGEKHLALKHRATFLYISQVLSLMSSSCSWHWPVQTLFRSFSKWQLIKSLWHVLCLLFIRFTFIFLLYYNLLKVRAPPPEKLGVLLAQLQSLVTL